MKLRPSASATAKSRAKFTTNIEPADVPPPRRRRRIIVEADANSSPPRSGRHALAKPPKDAPTAAPVIDSARLRFQRVQIDLLKLPKRELRLHTEDQIAMLAASIGEFGFNVPIILTRDYEVIAGAARVCAAKINGMSDVPAIFADHLSGPAIEAFRIADNKLAQLGKWNEKELSKTLKSLMDLSFDPQVLGFESLEIDILLQDDEQPEDFDPPPRREEARYKIVLGDIFMLGSHRVMCGNTLEAAHCAVLMGEDRAAMAFLDAPFNVPIAGHVTKDRDCAEFAMGIGEMSDPEFIDFLAATHANVVAGCRPGALIFSCMDWRGIPKLLAAAQRLELDYLNLAVWAKNKAGMGSFYRSQHELVGVFRTPGAAHVNNIMLGKHGRNRTNLWQYRTPVLNGSDTDDAVAEHATPKPWDMIADAIKDCTRRGDIVVDFFAGSGATLVAAEKTGRAARILEIDTRYVGNMLARYERLFGVEAIHVETGLSVAELTRQRKEA